MNQVKKMTPCNNPALFFHPLLLLPLSTVSLTTKAKLLASSRGKTNMTQPEVIVPALEHTRRRRRDIKRSKRFLVLQAKEDILILGRDCSNVAEKQLGMPIGPTL
jgi:hypothetical protein